MDNIWLKQYENTKLKRENFNVKAPVAQMAVHSAVNRRVVGSSPTGSDYYFFFAFPLFQNGFLCAIPFFVFVLFLFFSEKASKQGNMEGEECECELVRACGALHCQRCWSLFSATEDGTHAPQVLQCGHCLCRACVAADMARLWDPTLDPEASTPPCTCPVCRASYASDDAHPVLPFFCAALAQAVAELAVLARAPPAAETASTATESASTEQCQDTPVSQSDMPSLCTEVSPEPEQSQSEPEHQPEPEQPEQEQQPKPEQPEPELEQQQQHPEQQPQPQPELKQRFLYLGFSVGRDAVCAPVERWLGQHAGGVLGWLAPGRAATARAQADRALASLAPAFVPFRVLRRGTHRAAVCAWAADPAEGRAAAAEAARALPWDTLSAHACVPDERPRPGLWLPPSAARAETAPRCVPRLPAVAGEGAEARVGAPVGAGVVHVPFWVAAVDVAPWHTLLVCAVDGTVVGTRAALLPVVLEARAALDVHSADS